MITDLTKGNITKKLWAFSIPMLISVMFQQIYNIVDSMIAGKYVGEEALAAVGASYPITMIFIAVAMGCNIGCSVVISQLFGAKEYKKMKTAVGTTFISCGVLSVLLTAIGLLTGSEMMTLIHTPDNIFKDGLTYLNIYIAGLTFLFLYNICTGIFNALGDSRTPLYFLIGSSVGNIILDLVFVIVFKMGVAGVALATFVAQGIAGVLSSLALMRRMKGIKTEGRTALFSLETFLKISVIAVPSILQQSFISIGNMFIQSLINSYGSAVIAGYSAAIKLNTFTITSFMTLANGLSSFTAQNMGAGKIERVKKGFHSGLVLAWIVAIPFFVSYFFFSETMLRLFMDSTSEVAIATGKDFFRIVTPFYFAVSVKLMADSVLRGSGVMRYFMISTFSDLILRVVLSYALTTRFEAMGIWMSWPIGWMIGMLLSCLFYAKGVWRKKQPF